MYAYFSGVRSVKFVIVEPFTNATEDSRLGDNSRVSVGTVAENVEAENIKRRAHVRPLPKAMLSLTTSQLLQGIIGIFCTGGFVDHTSFSDKDSGA